jgi:hypothetical protein
MDQQTADLLTKVAGPVATVLASLTAASVAIAFGISQSRNAKRQISDGGSNIRGGGVEILGSEVRPFRVYHLKFGRI